MLERTSLQHFRRGLGIVTDLLLPHRCPVCGIVVPSPGGLCTGCWSDVTFLSAPLCDLCGYPFELAETAGKHCANCSRRPPQFDHARAAIAYDGIGRDLILRFKHGDRLDLAPVLARWSRTAVQAFLPDTDIIAPVPLHRRRLLARRYNQAALLTRAIADSPGTNAHHSPDLLQRSRHTASQGHMSARMRRRNVRKAFRVNPRRLGSLQGARVLLVDDVLTTGATMEECARTLRRNGAEAVVCVTVARVVRPGQA